MSDRSKGTRGPSFDGVVPFTLTFVLALALLAPRVCRTLALVGDSPELVAAGREWGVAHAPGYPLLVALLHLASALPLGNPAWNANLTSAVFRALTTAVVLVTVRRMTASTVAGVGAGLLLFLSRGFAFSSLYVDVFPLNDLFFAGLLALALPLARPAELPRPERRLAALLVVLGLGVAHHPTLLLAIPALATLASGPLLRSCRARPARLAGYVALVATPFAACYTLVLIAAARHPFVSWGEVHDLVSLARLIGRRDYGGPFPNYAREAAPDLGARLGGFIVLFWTSAGAIAIAMAVVGGFVLWTRSGRAASALTLAVAFTGPLFALVNGLFQRQNPDELALADRFVTMPLVPLAMLGGVALAPLAAWLRDRPKLASLRGSLPVALGALLAPPVASIDMSDDRRGEAFAGDLLHDVPDGSLVLLTGDIAIQVGQYVCVVEHACGDRRLVAPGMLFLDWYRAQVAARYPTIDLPDGIRSIRETHALVERELGRREVFALPAVLSKDPTILERFDIEPTLLLFRIRAREERASATAGFLERAEALSRGGGCDVCSLQPDRFSWPSFELEVEKRYEMSLDNQAFFAHALGDDALASRLHGMQARMVQGMTSWERIHARELSFYGAGPGTR